MEALIPCGSVAVEAQTIIWTRLGAPMVDFPICISHNFKCLLFHPCAGAVPVLKITAPFKQTHEAPSNKSTQAHAVDLRLLNVTEAELSNRHAPGLYGQCDGAAKSSGMDTTIFAIGLRWSGASR